MIIFMCKIVCVTNRTICKDDFLLRIEKIATQHPTAIILREKDLSETEYQCLADEVIRICQKSGTRCILHSFPNVARQLNHRFLHLPLPLLRVLSAEERKWFTILGASCHSVSDAVEAQKLGCTYITAGHIFDTDCKKGISGRGLDFLTGICQCADVPVYAIGGIHAQHYREVLQAGADGVCVMSGAMCCENIGEYFADFRER